MKRLKPAFTLCLTLCLSLSAILASCSSGRPDATAQRGGAAKSISPHLPFGNPSEAGSAPNNQLVRRPQFAALWNAKKRIANWVAWRLVAEDMGDTERNTLQILTP
jgi:endonuclease G, mitochondrial